MGLTLLSLILTQPTAQVPLGKVRLVVDEGGSAGPLTIDIAGLTQGVEGMYAPAPNHAYAYENSSTPPGTYNYTVGDAGPTHLPDLTGQFTIDPVPVVPGCTDPDADNYDPAATTDDGSCVVSQRLSLAAFLPALAPLGVPLLVTLASSAIAGAVPSAGNVFFSLLNLGSTAGVQLRLNGYLFTSGPLIAPGRFVDGPSLAAAIRAQPALAAALTLAQYGSDVVATPNVPGVAGLPTASSSNPALVSVGSTSTSAAALFSQRRYQWGAYLEVWAGCGTVFGGATSQANAVLAGRFVLPYRADNAYTFDIASLLRQFTGHAAPVNGVCADRLVSYFLRYGEEYADTATGLRRVRSAYETDVAWGLEAMEVPAQVAPGLRLLTARPQPWRVKPGDALPCGVLATPAIDRHLVLRSRPATSRATTDQTLTAAYATGQVVAPLYLLPSAGALSGALLDIADAAPELPGSAVVAVVAPTVLTTLDFTAHGQALTFVNRQGSQDTVYLNGTTEPASKRTAATYTTSAGPQQQYAEVALTSRLTSGLLSYAEWDWLRRELSTSPAAWLAGVPVLLTDVSTEADAVKQEYTLTVDYQPAPVRGLSN